ncbi:MAG: CCA tRNA nucleotidyltransferase [Planctomycetota bacterium]|jgi:poly(A) polymerase
MTVAPHDAEDPREVALQVAGTLRAAGHDALFCGGAVRDRLLGRTPLDYDVATSAPPEVGATLFPHAVMVGAKFGVLIVPGKHHDVEVATFRDDGLYVDGRRPDEVRYSDPPRDARRRDFTVNGLFEDPETGEILDYVDGRADLEARLVRAIGDPRARFREDHLRVLRAVRFAAQLNFAIEPETFDAVREMAGLVSGVSAERIRDEILRLLRAGRGRGLRLLRDAGLLEIVLPEVAAMQGVYQGPLHHPEGDVFVHTCLVLDGVEATEDEEETTDLLLAALLHDVAKPPTQTRDPDGRVRFHQHDTLGAEMTETILTRLRMPRRSVDRVQALVGSHMRFANLPQMRPAKRRRFLGDPDFGLHLRLHEADCGASHGDLSLATWCQDALEALAGEPILPDPLLRGRDLIALGFAPGKAMGEMLRWVRDQQLDGTITDRSEAVRRVRERYGKPAHEG